jgi:hypothetical protein
MAWLRANMLGIAAALSVGGAHARVATIVVDAKVSPAFDGAAFGAAGQYETITGRAFGELDPTDPRNALIQDIELAPRNARGMVEYTASFHIAKPIDPSKSSRLMWHDVPNRGGRVRIDADERASGDIFLQSGWQGDNAGATAPNPGVNEYVIVPSARNADRSPVTGLVMGRIVNAGGKASQSMRVFANPVPYTPVSLDTIKSTLTAHASETIDGKIAGKISIPSGDWAWAKCSDAVPFPGTPDPTQICLKNGFDAKLLYEVVFTAKDPPVLGIGFAAFRDVASFFRNAKQDDAGTANPVAGQVAWMISRGRSQSGNFLRGFLHLGFNQDEAGKQVYEGMWPIIAGRRISLNLRFAMPDGVMRLYEPGSEGPQWWSPWPDAVRGLPTAGILDRCTASKSCPKIVELFGAAEVWGLKLTPAWVGTAANADIPLPDNVRSYYIASSPHGGGAGGFTTATQTASCPGGVFGSPVLSANPMPYTETLNAIRAHFRGWVMSGTLPPPSIYPTLAAGVLVDPTKQAMGFPTLPGLPPATPTGLVNPLLDYDFGPGFNDVDGGGIATTWPPRVKKVIPAKVPRVDADGNELGGVPVVLRDAPLGTYLGWNITAGGFYKGQICGFAGGMIPFAKTKAERTANNDPRLSLEERYGTHDGYVAAVRTAAQKAVAARFLLPEDATALIAAARAGNVLK